MKTAFLFYELAYINRRPNFLCLLTAALIQEPRRQEIKSKMKYANVITSVRECLWQKAINFLSGSWHFNICITCYLQMIFCVCFAIPIDRVLFSFPLHLVIFLNFPCLKSSNSLWLKFHWEKLSEIHVVCLMEKIITRQMKQSMTHGNQGEWLPTQVSKGVSLFTLLPTYSVSHASARTHAHTYTQTRACTHTLRNAHTDGCTHKHEHTHNKSESTVSLEVFSICRYLYQSCKRPQWKVNPIDMQTELWLSWGAVKMLLDDWKTTGKLSLSFSALKSFTVHQCCSNSTTVQPIGIEPRELTSGLCESGQEDWLAG